MNINISIRRLTASHKLKLLLQDACRQLPISHLAVKQIDVVIEDINGPYKAGIDKRCHLKVRGSGNLAIDVDKIDSDLYCAIDEAFHRLTCILKRSVNKQLVDTPVAATGRILV